MQVHISPDLEPLIQEMLESGDYRSADEIVEEALRLMAEHDGRTRHLRLAVEEGFAQIERGERIVLTSERMDLIMQRAIENARQGKPVKDDVKP